MAQETNQSQAPLLCTTGCGFYGNPRNNGMCSVCYKDFLQRQNGNARVSQPDSSSADGSTGESCRSQGSPVPQPTTISHTDTQCGQSSNVINSSVPSEEECSSGAKSSLDTDDLSTTARGIELRGESSAACIAQGSQNTVLERSSSLGECSPNGKKKLEDTVDSLNAEKASEDSAVAAVDGEEKPRAKKNRCYTCNKKVGLTGFDCRCGNVFCGAHRYSDMHSCTFDYRADAAAKIKKENPVVVGEKIQKI